MNINLVKLQREKEYLDTDINFDSNIYHNKEILALNNMHITGSISYDSMENLCLDLNLTGNMTLNDTVTLEEINYPLDIKIKEEYELNEEFLQVYCEKEQNILDIMPILWENIVLEVPMRLTKTQNAELKGEGWSLGGEKIEEIDPRLEKLKELLDKREE